jgi:menaquinone-dependent protoporphyrinogen oxidase
MNVLVTVASKHGATTQIAEAIGRALAKADIGAEVVAPDDVRSLKGYDAVILGSAVYAGRWLDEAKRFVEREGPALAERPVWLFSSGPIGDPPKPEEEAIDVAAIRVVTGARDHRIFAGLLDKSRLGFGERAIVKVVRAEEGDYRPWPEIDEWVAGIAVTLKMPVA